MDNLTIKHTDILSENFQNLTEIALKEKKNYLNAKPFPNIVLNNFFKDSFLSKNLYLITISSKFLTIYMQKS